MCHAFLSLPFTFFGFPSLIGFPLGSVGKSFSISSESFTRQNEIGAWREGEAENEERAVNHAGKMEAVERAKDEMDRQVTKGKEKRMRQRENGWLKSVTDFSIS